MEQRLLDYPAEVHALILPVGENADAQIAGTQDAEPLLELAPDEAAPLGSIFKLYVLLAVADAVAEGELGWDELLEMHDGVRSLPSGTLQDEPDGTQVSVAEAATAMIEVSDNTATDMLIQRVGREAVEAAVVAASHHDPSLLAPFPSTREMFQLGWGDPAHLERWVDGDEQDRRELLNELSQRTLDPLEVTVTGDPLWPQGVDWFASAHDVAAVHMALAEHSEAQVQQILTKNPGIDPGSWDHVAFKGGASLGVLTGSWLVGEDPDEDGNEDTVEPAYVVVFQAATDDAAGLGAHQEELFRLAETTLELLGE